MSNIMKEFVKDRNNALSSMDKKRILAYCNKYGIDVPKNEEDFWAGIHQAICNLYLSPNSNISIEKYHSSYDWLKNHGYNPAIVPQKGDRK